MRITRCSRVHLRRLFLLVIALWALIYTLKLVVERRRRWQIADAIAAELEERQNALEDNNMAAMAMAMLDVSGKVTPIEEIPSVSPEDANSMHFRTSNAPTYIPQHRLVHLDLKGAPPKLSYFSQLFPLLKQIGATGLLIEYEDMFPFWGPLQPLAAKNAFSSSDISTLLEMARDNQLEVIPLLQSFGHLEFMLKLKPFSHLREVSIYPQALCPSNQEAVDLIKTLVDQVMALHPDVKWLHIGCDEVFHLGWCSKCLERAKDYRSEYSTYTGFLFLEHVKTIASYVKNTYNVQPIVWDDMFRSLPVSDIERSGLHGGLVEPMIWVYTNDIYRYVTPTTWNTYSKLFPNVWAAGAFKGAYGETRFVPDAFHHVLNAAEWLTVLRRESLKFNSIQGMVLTGWQRYDHYSVLCELLPASVPSLVSTLLTLTTGRFGDDVLWNVSEALGCDMARVPAHTVDTFIKDPYLWRYTIACEFPGKEAFHTVKTLNHIKPMILRHLRKMTEEEGWLSAFNVKHNFASPFRVGKMQQRNEGLLRTVKGLRNASASLVRFFDNFTVAEWQEQNVEPLHASLQMVKSLTQQFLEQRYWPKRPFV